MKFRNIAEKSSTEAPLPKFDAPPVVETVIGVQFPALAGYTMGHAGWFWKSYAPKLGEWPKLVEAPPVPDQLEIFGPDAGWVTPGLQFISAGQTPGRTQLIRDDDERMIQLQNSRLILNWKRGKGRYPSFDALLPEFQNAYELFGQFAKDADIGPIVSNQWEITYVNHLPRGEMWTAFEDLKDVFSGSSVPQNIDGTILDTYNANWRGVIGDNVGRLYVNIQHVRIAPSDEEVIRLQFVARGPTNAPDWDHLHAGCRIGHEAIVRTFAAITTDSAHKFWKRTQ